MSDYKKIKIRQAEIKDILRIEKEAWGEKKSGFGKFDKKIKMPLC